MKTTIHILLTLSLLGSAAALADPRSAAQRAAFFRANPCPVTGAGQGSCPGYQVDHIAPLCAQGADHPANMQWLTVAEHKQKTRHDLRICRALRRGILVEF